MCLVRGLRAKAVEGWCGCEWCMMGCCGVLVAADVVSMTVRTAQLRGLDGGRRLMAAGG